MFLSLIRKRALSAVIGAPSVTMRPAWLLGAGVSLAFVALFHGSLHERTMWTLLGILAGAHAFGLRPKDEMMPG